MSRSIGPQSVSSLRLPTDLNPTRSMELAISPWSKHMSCPISAIDIMDMTAKSGPVRSACAYPYADRSWVSPSQKLIKQLFYNVSLFIVIAHL